MAFDAASDQCADERYVRVAIGFDALGAAPMRGGRTGAGAEKATFKVVATPATGAGQSQRQG